MIYNILNISKTGLKAMQTKIDSTSNDIANVNTFGYKKKNISFQELLLNDITENEVFLAGNSNNQSINAGSRSGVGKTDFIQGILTPSSNEFHMAIEGEGFFGVRNENDDFLLTRVGAFHMNEDFSITNDRGHHLELDIKVPVEEWTEAGVSIGANGHIYSNVDGDNRLLGQVILYQPEIKDNLRIIGEMGYYNPDNTNLYNSINSPDRFGKVIQNMLENSNVDLSESMVDLITAQRAYSANGRAIQTTDDIMGMINNIK